MKIKKCVNNFMRVMIFFGAFGAWPAAAEEFGLGVIIGAPTGISGKYYLNRENAIDGAIAWDLGENRVLHVHGDYLWHRPVPTKSSVDGKLLWYFGIGARIISWSDYDHPHHHHHTRRSGAAVGPRAPIGIAFTFPDPVIEVFAEAALVMDIIPGIDIDLDAGIGGRFYF